MHTSKKILSKLLFILSLFSFIYITGCAVVQPIERERLSDPNMIFDENPLQKGIQEHFLFIREGTEGGDGAQSGGCGCG